MTPSPAPVAGAGAGHEFRGSWFICTGTQCPLINRSGRRTPSRYRLAGARLAFSNSISTRMLLRKATRRRSIATLRALGRTVSGRRRAQGRTAAPCSNRIGSGAIAGTASRRHPLGRHRIRSGMCIIGRAGTVSSCPSAPVSVGRRAGTACGAARRRYPRARTRSTAAKAATDGAARGRGRRGTAPSDRRRKCRMRE
jgi:hypothetical protein